MRDNILEYIKRELIGPDPVKPHVQANGEEILVNDPPRLRYGAGILFPATALVAELDANSPEEEELLKDLPDESNSDADAPVITSEAGGTADKGEDFEEEVALANTFLPAAMGFSCFSKIPAEGFTVAINAAVYEFKEYLYYKEDEAKTEVRRKAYFRIPVDQVFTIKPGEIPQQPSTSMDRILHDNDGKELQLKLNIRNRTVPGVASENTHLLTFTLVNLNHASKSNIRNEDCFFQVSFEVRGTGEGNCFVPYKTATYVTDKEDEQSNTLLFRDKKTFAVGHGCSPRWNDHAGDMTGSIRTESISSYEIKPIMPNDLKNVKLNMFGLSDLSATDITASLTDLVAAYRAWIDQQQTTAEDTLEGDLLETARKHLASCRKCLARIDGGVELLKSDTQVNRAFRLMNRAMLLQQLHYSIYTRAWLSDKDGNICGLTSPHLDGHEEEMFPDIHDPNTWPKNSDGLPKVGSWRPFQLAFVLMNLHAMNNAEHEDRTMVDLIWFPTGGGKTEAYLGLSAFTIFLKRLKKQDDSGTTILMRYTLRLLTTQQFQRAASLICACDKIRHENQKELGSARITIGLWVGESLTPTSRQAARTIFRKMEQGRENDNPFIVLKCPWCAAQMGYIKDAKSGDRVKGYKRRKRGTYETIVYQCDNGDCTFSKSTFGLPLMVIDEDIYADPPTLLIGTVDKFAMLTWRPDARSLFGFRDDHSRLSPPELIIQDELHLISGPLGSMVGLYETMIEELCTAEGIKPKIIASSATISRAREQINSLYGRGVDQVTIFPSQGLNAGDSFFAYEDKNKPGRLYTGIFASALPSHATAQVRILSALLQSVQSIPVKDERERDPYWTILAYFNSIRELGHAATLIRADIREYMNSIWSRKSIKGDQRRFINRDIELTSRINSSDIPEYLEELSRPWIGNKVDYPVDICLATNMVSVGVDIPRLGLMTVVGQPKTTSEYIQATSRVGRSVKGPGLVLTVYNCSKPRDRSHFEHFQEYHSKIYSKVEPTSVTPFSAPARERALHSVLVGLIRFYSARNRETPKPFPDEEVIRRVTKIIYDRVSLIDEAEYDHTLRLIEEKLKYWKNELPPSYGSLGQNPDTPLMYAAGTTPPDDIKNRAWSTPTSMRNVDATCDARIIIDYPNTDI
jgi:hypothetical protein